MGCILFVCFVVIVGLVIVKVTDLKYERKCAYNNIVKIVSLSATTLKNI